ncbi:MAG: adenosine kinase [Spirochaetes bacterium]|nr:adenosine kinase [Spirochaetota bacterium]
MERKTYDVVGIGSPLVDFTVNVTDSMLKELEMEKGCMHLIDADKSKYIFEKIKEFRIEKTPGGSSANTLAGLSIFGGNGALMGKLGNDENAEYYIEMTEKCGTKSILKRHDSITGHAITFISPDFERTFSTHLGAASFFCEEDIDADVIRNSNILHVEGFLLELPENRKAVLHAMNIAMENGVKVSIDLADPGLIIRINDVIKDSVKKYADIVFVNETEAKAFTGREEEEALEILSEQCEVAVVKLGGLGSLIKTGKSTCRIPVNKADVVNTNGAGDMYAAGLLFGISRGIPVERAGRIASYASSLVVSQVSTRLNEKIDVDSLYI